MANIAARLRVICIKAPGYRSISQKWKLLGPHSREARARISRAVFEFLPTRFFE